MQIEKAFSYQFDDPEWVTKLGLGALISLVPILNLAAAGYMVAIIRNMAAGASKPLPEWDDFGRKWVDGLILALAGLVYAAPALVALSLPIGLLASSGAISSNGNLESAGRGLAAAGGILLAIAVIFLLLYSLALSLLRPVIVALFSRDGTFASLFRLREVMEIISRHTRAFFVTWLAVILAGLGIGLVAGFANLLVGWIPCVGWVVSLLMALGMAIYILTVEGYIYGQFRLEALGGASVVPAVAGDAKSQHNPGDLSS